MLLVLVVLTALTLAAPRLTPPRTPIGEDEAVWPGWGFTHTQFSADYGDVGAVARVHAALGAVPMVQGQAIMGWGAENPEPSPGEYDFSSLDRRMDLIYRSGGLPVITLCCAPDWMKGGQPGTTDWNEIETAPLPEHFGDFAALSATIAKRYPFVRHFLVWNEFKGFFDDASNSWDVAEYTHLYNAVHDALKAVNPANQVGGPYLDFDSVPVGSRNASNEVNGAWGALDDRVVAAFAYWKHHNKGADFVVAGGHATTDVGAVDEFGVLEKFAAIGDWLRGQSDLPLWWAEWYTDPDSLDWTPAHRTALRVAAMIQLASTGAQTILYWNPRPGAADCAVCLWTDASEGGGGQPLAFLTDTLQRFARLFPPRLQRWKVDLGDGVLALASPQAVVMVNTRSVTTVATIDGRSIELAAYETRWVTPAASEGAA